MLTLHKCYTISVCTAHIKFHTRYIAIIVTYWYYNITSPTYFRINILVTYRDLEYKYGIPKPLFIKRSRQSVVLVDDKSYVRPGVLFRPPQMHLILKALLSNILPIEYSVIVAEKCLELIQSNINDWIYGHSNVHYEYIKTIFYTWFMNQ